MAKANTQTRGVTPSETKQNAGNGAEKQKMERTDIENKKKSCERDTVFLVRNFVNKGLTVLEVQEVLQKVSEMSECGLEIEKYCEGAN